MSGKRLHTTREYERMAAETLRELGRTDPRCRKTHRPRIDFESPGLGWFCETCHADLELDDSGQFVNAALPGKEK